MVAKKKTRYRAPLQPAKSLVPFRGNRHLQRRLTVAVRFWQKVAIAGEDDCWIWLAATSGRAPHLYGNFSYKGKKKKATHISWFLSRGRHFPVGYECCHTCDNPLCVNPNHLFKGTRLDNVKDMLAKGRCGGKKS